MAKTLTVPDIRVSGIYYPQLLDMLVAFKRENVPELTDESEFEPTMQLIRAFALTGHLSNTLLDVVANEGTFATARLPQSLRDMLKLIGERLLPGSPSEVDLLLELAAPLTALTEIAPAGTQVATAPNGALPAIVFEIPDAVDIPRTDRVSFVFRESALGVFTDITAAMLVATPTAAFAGDVAPGRKVYVGLADAMFNKLGVAFDATTAPGVDGVWEFFDGNLDLSNPDSVVVVGASLRLDVNGLLGSANRAGAEVRVRLSEGTEFETCTSQWDGSNNFIETVGALGQVTPSTSILDYSVGSEWRELAIDADGTVGFTTSGTLEFTLPQDLDRDWRQTTVNNQVAFWLRFRVVDVPVSIDPDLTGFDVTLGKQWAIVEAVQGRSQVETLGSSDGSASQKFTTTKPGYVDGTLDVSVDGVAWTPVENFLRSSASDKHYLVELGAADAAVARFGDGVAGAIPPVGANNVVAAYRHGVADNGNVGDGTITSDRSGLSRVNSVTNPRAAVGWSAGEAADDAGLERAKIRAPGTVRIKDVALNGPDTEKLALEFEDANGAIPFSRASAIEGSFGPKSIELVLVANGDGVPTTDQLTAVQTYFNGDKYASPPVERHLVANQEVQARALAPRTIDIQAVVSGTTFEVQQVADALALLLQPSAKNEDDEYEWDFGGEVPLSRIDAEIFDAVPGKIRKVTSLTLNGAAVDVTLGRRELPVAGTITIVKGT